MVKNILLVSAIIILSNNIFGIENSFAFRHLTLEDGISNSHVNCITQDQEGFIWIGTENGLNKYDGYTFTQYYANPEDSLSLQSDEIFSLFIDKNNTLWVGTFRGLHRYNAKTDDFSFISLHSTTLNQSIKPILALEGDENENLWIATSGNGLIQYNIKENTYTSHLPSNNLHNKISTPFLLSLFTDKQQNLWIGSENEGFSIYSKSTGHFKNLKLNHKGENKVGSNAVQCFFEISKDSVLIGTRNGLYCYNTKNDEIKPYRYNNQLLISNPNIAIHDIIRDYKQRLWISTKGDGLICIDKSKIEYLRHENNNEQSIINDNTRSLFEDNQKNIWVTSYQGGINLLPNKIEIFKNYNLFDAKGAYESTTVTSIISDINNNLWVGTDGGGLKYINRKKNKIKHFYPDENTDQSITDNVIMSLLNDKDNNIWIGTYMGGLSVYNPNKNRFKHYKANNTQNAISNNFVASLVQDSRGQIWIGTNGGGLNKFNPKTNTFEHFRMKDTTRSTHLINDWINTLTIDNNDRIWIGTFWGLSIYDPFSDHFINYIRNSGDAKGLSNSVIYCILESSKNEIWIGTRNGLNKYIPESNTFKTYNKANGLSGNIIYGIEEDNKGDLWLSTNRGLCQFNPNTEQVHNYFTSDGLQSNQFFRGASYQNKSGELFFGGINGFNSFLPDSILEKYKIPKAIITQFKIFDKPIRPGHTFDDRIIIDESISIEREINLKHKDNSFSFELASLDYILPENTLYQCKMEGFDIDWKTLDHKQRLVTYTNLDAGEYEFKIKASSVDGRWGNHYNSLLINIAPPIYKTWWAFSLYYLLIALILYATYFITIRRLKLSAQVKLERLNRERSEELSQTKLKFFTNISHEFRTPITLIVGPMEKMLSDKNISKKYGKTMNMMLKNAHRLLRLVNQLMDLRKIEMESMKLKVTEGDLLKFIEDIHFTFNEFAEQKNINFYFNTEIEKLNIWFDADKVDKIIFNLLSNAFKFTPKNGTIGLIVSQTESFVKIRVKDSGKGIPLNEQQYIFDRFYQTSDNSNLNATGTGVGLSLTKHLTKLHKGEISFESEEGQGTTFTLLLPIDNSIYSEDEKGNELVLQSQKSKYLLDASNQSTHKIASPKTEDSASVLIVEDNHDLRKYIAEELSEHYNIYEAENGKIGLDKALIELPDLIISDIMMPEMDGLALCKAIKENIITSHIPVILLTAKTSIEQRIEGIEQGADSYIPKPFHPGHLAIRAQKLIELRQTLKIKFSEQLNNIDKPIQKVEDKFLSKLTDIILSNIDEPEMTIEWLGEQMNISRGHLHRKIKQLTDKSPSEFVRIIKLNEAATLLKKNEFNISEISYMVGFNSPSYFTNSFKNHFRISPTEFIERNKNE